MEHRCRERLRRYWKVRKCSVSMRLDCQRNQRTDLDMARCVEQNVVGLDVTVDDVLRVQMTQALARLHRKSTQYHHLKLKPESQ